jgi:hypothetical protein
MFPLIVAQNPQAASIVPAVLAAPFIKLGVIREVGVTFDLPVIDVHQYWHRGTDRSSFDKWLRDLVWRALYRNRDLHIPKRTAPPPGAVETRPRQHA